MLDENEVDFEGGAFLNSGPIESALDGIPFPFDSLGKNDERSFIGVCLDFPLW